MGFRLFRRKGIFHSWISHRSLISASGSFQDPFQSPVTRLFGQLTRCPPLPAFREGLAGLGFPQKFSGILLGSGPRLHCGASASPSTSPTRPRKAIGVVVSVPVVPQRQQLQQQPQQKAQQHQEGHQQQKH
jgi:hypothetical protein